MYKVSQESTVLVAVRLPSTSALVDKFTVLAGTSRTLTGGQPHAAPKLFCAFAEIEIPRAKHATEKRKRFTNIINSFRLKEIGLRMTQSYIHEHAITSKTSS